MSSRSFELKTEIVRAGAGAGKTTQLTSKVLEFAQDFYKQKMTLPKVVVTTFTKKATEELRERLIKKACELGDPNLIQFVNSKSNLHISTIHGVFSLFLHRYGLWMGLDSGFRIMDSHVARTFARKNLRDALIRESESSRLLDYYSADQLTKILQQFAEQYGRSKSIKPFSFEELQEAVRQNLEYKRKQGLDVAESILAEANDQKWLAYGENLKETTLQHLGDLSAIVSSENSAALLAWQKSILSIKKPSYLKKNPPVSEEANEALVLFLSDLKKLDPENYTAQNINQFVEVSDLFFKFAGSHVEKVQQVKSNLGVLEMSELEVLTRQMILEFPQIANAFASDWDFWLIDEFQDTSLIQVEILNHFIKNNPAYYVGDPQQSIYLFRGARSQVFQEKEKQIKNQGGQLSSMLKNYRSEPRLLLFFNDFFTGLDRQFSKMTPREEVGPIDDQQVEPVARFLISQKEDEEPYLGIIELIVKGIQSGLRYEDYCILARTNSELGELAQYFESYGLPTQIHSADGFYERREVLDVLSLLKFLTNPHDNTNLIRVLRSPWFKVEDMTLATALSKRPIFYWSTFQRSLSDHPVIGILGQALKEIESKGYFTVLMNLVRSRGILDFSLYHDPTGRRESNIWKFLMKVKEAEREPGFHVLTLVNQAFSGLRSVLGDEEWDAVAALEPNRLNLMTIHKSKGLKFKHVIVPNLHKRPTLSSSRGHEMLFLCDEEADRFTLAFKQGEEQKFKHSMCGLDLLEALSEKEKEEHLRLLYVALTRAESTVNLHWVEPATTNSMADLISMNLTDGIHQTDFYSYEVRRSFSPIQKHTVIKTSGDQVRPIWSSASPRAMELQKVSVTKLLQADKSKSDEQMGLVSADALPVEERVNRQLRKIRAPVFGQRLHNLLERFKFIGHADKLLEELESDSKEDSLLRRAFEYTISLGAPPIKKLIENGEVEWGFQLKSNRHIIEGQIDLWGTVTDPKSGQPVTWVIDYKSGSSLYSEKAFDQLNLYSLAVRKMGVSHPIRLGVVYAMEQKVEIRDANQKFNVDVP